MNSSCTSCTGKHARNCGPCLQQRPRGGALGSHRATSLRVIVVCGISTLLINDVCRSNTAFARVFSASRAELWSATGTEAHRRSSIGRRAELQSKGNPTQDAMISFAPEARIRQPDNGLKPQLIRTGNPVMPTSWNMERPAQKILPPTLYRPNRTVIGCFLSDPNYIFKMTSVIKDTSPRGRCLIELGPGTGALTSKLYKRYPDMIGIEQDNKAIHDLTHNVPGCTIIRSDVLSVNYTKLAELRGGPLTIVGNLPYHVSCQLAFVLADHANSIKAAYLTFQKEVGARITSLHYKQTYGIPSVIFQLYADLKVMHHIPPTAYFPRPNVESSYIKFDFASAMERRQAMGVDPRDLKNLTVAIFRNGKRRVLSNSLSKILQCHTTLIDVLPADYANTRGILMEPWEFVHLTQMIFGKKEFPTGLRRAFRGQFTRRVKISEQ